MIAEVDSDFMSAFHASFNTLLFHDHNASLLQIFYVFSIRLVGGYVLVYKTSTYVYYVAGANVELS